MLKPQGNHTQSTHSIFPFSIHTPSHMIALSLHSTGHQFPITTLSCSYKPSKASFRATSAPARDRIIDFGKFKGRMLGTLPSTYLRWVSKNLRARDFEEWAKLADEVLTDPVYKDRVEWEFAEKLLNGDILTSPSLQQGDHSAVSQLLELSERFGWDNEDKAAWSKIDFKFLGTSRGGRIPRVDDNRRAVETDTSRPLGMRRSRASQSSKPSEKSCDEEVEERRKERRERSRLSRGSSHDRPAIEDNEKGSFGILEKVRHQKRDEDFVSEDRVVEVQQRRFPGREGLLKKVLSRQRL